MQRKLIISLAGAFALAACASGTQVSSGGEVASATPANGGLIPAGTTIGARFDQAISTASREGDPFTATVISPVYAQDGTIAIPDSSVLMGRVTGIQKASLPTDQNVIRLNFETLKMRGKSYPFSGSISNVTVKNTAGKSTARDAATGAAAGAVLGAVLSGGELSKIIAGGVLGAAAGTVVSLGTAGGPSATIPAGSDVTVRSTQDVHVAR